MARYRTIKDIDRAGLDLRLWCYACQHTAVLDGIIWSTFEDRGFPLEIDQARAHFRCRRCRSKDVLLIPARATGFRPKGPENIAAAWFFARRSAAKKRR
ncbi:MULTISPECIES: hypothetical protein [unclassified Novosphingobium]|uniref:hypothetical protein n=1 Tax=unclassified Novosphingobium TaxID=2644732 RepID=UPI00146BC94D|nr:MULTISPECIES: hypothetical protein [unclassified Novosphingobium]NMN07525.1 hypothetical protein [Novosphingobium sp. SG919]NMN89872.1 hypothetical protein [Novosphingobium sp. SG916]